jgi:hypothetical protein
MYFLLILNNEMKQKCRTVGAIQKIKYQNRVEKPLPSHKYMTAYFPSFLQAFQ